jgi:hypothetical protein
MSTQENTENHRRIEQLHHIYPLRPVRLGRTEIAPSLVWAAVLPPFWIIIFLIALLSHVTLAVVAAVAFGVLAFLFWYLWIHSKPYEEKRKSRLAIYYRKRRKRYRKVRGELDHCWAPEQTKETFGTLNPDTRPPLKIDRIGPLSFHGHALDDKGQKEIGILNDELVGTASSTFLLFSASLLNAGDMSVQERLDAFGRMLAVVSRDKYTRYLEWRDVLYRGEVVNGSEILAKVRDGANIVAPKDPHQLRADTLFAERTEGTAAAAWNHRSSLTLTIDLDQVKGNAEDLLEERTVAYFRTANQGVDGKSLSALGLRDAYVLNRRDLIVDTRASLDPVGCLPRLLKGIAGDKRIHLDEYDAYPANGCLDPGEHPEWMGCIKLGGSYVFGLEVAHPTKVGLTSKQWHELLAQEVNRTVVVIFDMKPEDVAKNRATKGAAGLDRPGNEIAAARAAQIQEDIMIGHNQGGYVRAFVIAWGNTPQEAKADADHLEAFAGARGITLDPMTDREDQIPQILIPAGRGLQLPDLPLWMRLWSYTG